MGCSIPDSDTPSFSKRGDVGKHSGWVILSPVGEEEAGLGGDPWDMGVEVTGEPETIGTDQRRTSSETSQIRVRGEQRTSAVGAVAKRPLTAQDTTTKGDSTTAFVAVLQSVMM